MAFILLFLIVGGFTIILLASMGLDRWYFSKRLNHPALGMLASVTVISVIFFLLVAAIYGEVAAGLGWSLYIGIPVLIIRFLTEVWGWKRRTLPKDDSIFE